MNILGRPVLPGVGWDMDSIVSRLLHFAAIERRDGDRPDSQALRTRHRVKEVRRIAGRGDRYQHVTGPSEHPELSREHFFEARIVSNGREYRRIIGQADRAKGYVVAVRSDGEVVGKVA